MLFLLFQLGNDRYALEAKRVVEVIPCLALKGLPQAPRGVAGMINYRGRPIPAVDLSALVLNHPAADLLSTRIIVIQVPDEHGGARLVGLVAERATETFRKEPTEFVDPGMSPEDASYLGPVFMDPLGPVQWVKEDRLLSDPVRQLLSTLRGAATEDGCSGTFGENP